MKNEKKSASSDAEVIAAIENRLRWFMEEATDEEFDAEKVDRLVDTLNELKPLEMVEEQSDEEVLARFHDYVKMREAEERKTAKEIEETEETEAAAAAEKTVQPAEATTEAEKAAETMAKLEKATTDEAVLDAKAGKAFNRDQKHKGIGRAARAHKFIAAAAAVVLVILVAGGSLGAVNANQGNGFFFWLQKDDEGITMITSPENMDGDKEVEHTEEYYSMGTVPEEYLPYVVNKDEMSQLQDYELKKVTVTKSDIYCRVMQWFVDDSGEENVYAGALIYEEEKHLTKEVHLSKNVEAIESENGIEEGILLRENTFGKDEGKIFFYVANIKYFVEGDIETEALIHIAEAYRDKVLN